MCFSKPVLAVSAAAAILLISTSLLAQEVEVAPITPPAAATPQTPPPLTPGVPGEAPVVPPAEVVPRIAPEVIQIEVPPIARTVEFLGNTVISSDELLRVSGITPGQLVTEEVFAAAIQNIELAYQQRGYLGAVVEVDLPSAGQAGPAVFHIQELRITAVRIVGLERTDEFAISRMLTVAPDQLLSRGAVARDFLTLQQLGIFEDITFNLVPTEPGEADLVWNLVEREQFNYITVGGSYSPQDRLTGSGQVVFGNFRGRAERLSITASIGSIDGRLGGEVEYFSPWIAPGNTALLLNVHSVPRYRFGRAIATVPDTDRYFERRTGFRGILSRPVRDFLTLAAGLRYENVDVSNLPTELLTDPASQGGSIFLGSLRGTWDRRNSTIDPSTGTLTIGFLEAGTSNPDIDGTDGIAKAWFDRRWYFPARRVEFDPISGQPRAPVPVIAIRGLLGGSLGDLPFFEQYFVGGIGDLPLRGYLESRFWGKYAVVANVEYRYPLTRALSAVAFVDAGDAWGTDFLFSSAVLLDTDFEQHRGFRLRVGAGVGVRYATPLGPLRLDLAYGEEFRTHFAVGQAF